MLEQWRHVHNVIVPPAALTLDEVRARAARYRLENAYADGVLVGCTTVRPPARPDGGPDDAAVATVIAPDDAAVATVIARVLPPYRHQGLGTALYDRALAHARALGAHEVETCVLAANTDGLRFAHARGFAETDRYVLDGERDEWVDLRLTAR
ncbi:GNAT family N-acetyltransferase [Streptomyces sp. NPDC058417]|uniref:GNAT family N-acetyltransferase n=1 Tax=unclassified Streptomyces TaxID=2593676 RepID=UPI003649CA8E